jgi:hypothetical protein
VVVVVGKSGVCVGASLASLRSPPPPQHTTCIEAYAPDIKRKSATTKTRVNLLLLFFPLLLPLSRLGGADNNDGCYYCCYCDR